ncbi:MAG: cation:proton antiporter, partial [Thermoplasmata archaeon]|nr:cation:proton antiporter [Thermoplasmata archaeon]
ISYALLEIFVLLALAHLFGSITQRYGYPRILGEVLAGLVIGSYALGGVINNLLGIQLFDISDFVLIFADFSVILLIFAAGLEGGLTSLRSSGIWAVLAAVAGDLVPFAGTVAFFIWFYPLSTALLLGVAAGATSTAVVASVLQSEGLSGRATGQFLLSVAAIDDVVGLILLSIVLAIRGGQINLLAISGGIAYSVIAWVILLGASVLVIPRLFRIPWVHESRDAPFVVLFALVALVGVLGFSALIGAFIAGLAIAESLAASRTRQTVELLLVIFGALFFVVIGAQFDVGLLLDPKVLAFAGVLGGIAAVGKFVGVVGFARARFRSWPIARSIAVGLVPRGEIGLIVGAVGLSVNAFDQRILGAVILMSIFTTLLGGVLFREMVGPLKGIDPTAHGEAVVATSPP